MQEKKDLFTRSVTYPIRPDYRISELTDFEILKVIKSDLCRWEIGEFKILESILYYKNLSYTEREKTKIGLNQLLSMDFYPIDKGEFKITHKGNKRFIKFLFTDRRVMINTITEIAKGMALFAFFAAFTLLIKDWFIASFILIASFSFWGLVLGIKYLFPFVRYKVMIKRIIIREELRINEL